MEIITQIIITLIVVSVLYASARMIGIISNKKLDPLVGKISFKESMDLAELPIITFTNNGKKYNFLFDTGASCSSINAECLVEFEHEETNKLGTLFGVEGNLQDSIRYIKANLNYRNREYSEEFQVIDLSSAFSQVKANYGVSLSGILGNSFFTKYKYVLDFDELTAYSYGR